MTDLHERLLAEIYDLGQHLVGCVSCTTCEASALTRAVRAVVELHKPTDIGGGLATCEECDGRWAPCPTIKIIAAQLGVEIGETPK